MKFATKAVHVGSEPESSTGAVIAPISISTTFQQDAPGKHRGFEYSRSGNPTRERWERALAAIEGGAHALSFSSGLAATTTLTMAVFGPGGTGNIVSIDDVYGGTNRLFSRVLSSTNGIKVTFVNYSMDSRKALQAIKTSDVPTKLVWIETPTNPTLKLVDIKAVCESVKAHDSSIVIVVDNTFMSPFFQTPLALGADVVVHSITKYINGHCDVVMGAVIMNNTALFEKVKFLQNAVGAVPSPFDCYLAHRGLKTLALRMKQHESNALSIARYCEAHPKVVKVYYPGLPSHPQHELAKTQMSGFGGMISIVLKGGVLEAEKFIDNLEFFTLAESLGGVESLIELPAIMTHASVSAEKRAELGISDSFIRMSVGIEDIDDLIMDITNALSKI